MNIVSDLKEVLRESIQPKTENIKRHKVYKPDGDLDGVLTKAREVCGYFPTAAGIRQLETALHELEIEILDTKQCQEYIKKRETKTHHFAWYKIEDYKLPIPVHVLNKAIQIKERLPEVEIAIVNFEKRDSRAGLSGEFTRGYGDPFLFVSCGGQGWYVEVWDEPEFEGRATR